MHYAHLVVKQGKKDAQARRVAEYLEEVSKVAEHFLRDIVCGGVHAVIVSVLFFFHIVRLSPTFERMLN